MSSNVDERINDNAFLKKRFHHLVEGDIHSDCEFIVGPERKIIKGHKLIFSAASDVFDAMFYGPLKEDSTVNIEDLSADGFEGMKTFIYTGEISFSSVSHALFTYISAQKYLVTQLENVCIKFIEENLKPSQVLEFYELCQFNCITKFKELCTKIIQENTNEIVHSDYFITVKPETIELILELPALKLSSEIKVFEHFERWALAEAERKAISDNDIASSFNNLKKLIRFLTITGEEFVSRVGDSKLLTPDEKHAIACNKLKSSSKPMPDSISLLEQPRMFNLAASVYYHGYHVFAIRVDNANSSKTGYALPGLTSNNQYTFTFHIDFHSGFIFFRVNTSYYNEKSLYIIKYKFRVSAKNECDDLVFENEYSDYIHQNAQIGNRTIFLEVIPIFKLRNERFNDKLLSIEGTFKVEKINL
ncbi:BTB/POZ domain-containing protein 3 [Nilaparvata lugens]|uniref:BTB/POZ domain-containing protein 3 n=1 Tax=Nilaparvata lugens TaxID=108931 RepID=UPI00193CFC8F|nr:BTB/POZ domain-containing protein 3 [Nilaparvata lugens]XP_039289393.1 BTB/POZ domain-containing protein 3 [Nilaparvata lugens]